MDVQNTTGLQCITTAVREMGFSSAERLQQHKQEHANRMNAMYLKTQDSHWIPNRETVTRWCNCIKCFKASEQLNKHLCWCKDLFSIESKGLLMLMVLDLNWLQITVYYPFQNICFCTYSIINCVVSKILLMLNSLPLLY